MILNAAYSGEGRSFFFLHGFLGSGDSWKGIARSYKGEYRTVCPDARNHGTSPHSEGMTYPLMAGDIIETADSLGADDMIILGHSMGGKTAMETALAFPRRVKALIVVDISPLGYPPKYDKEIQALADLDVSVLKTRQEAMDALENAIPDRITRSFFLKNLRRGENGDFSWRVNMPGLIRGYRDVWAGVDPGRSYDGPVLFIRGAESNYIENDSDYKAISSFFPRSMVKTVDGAGHWVHSDKPDELIETVNDFLRSI